MDDEKQSKNDIIVKNMFHSIKE